MALTLTPPFRARGVIIDLDGTLVDTVEDLAAAGNGMLARLGRDPFPVERIAGWIGKGAEVLVHRLLTGSGDGRVSTQRVSDALSNFLELYAIENGRRSRVYPAVADVLDEWRARGLRLACVTNKPRAAALCLLESTGLAGRFDLLVGGDELARRKPDPLPMLHVCDRFRIAPREMIAIGDSLNDSRAARAAGIPAVLVTYGYNEGEPLTADDADLLVHDFGQLSGLIGVPVPG
jgi:phosphoglycolate phosphatase